MLRNTSNNYWPKYNITPLREVFRFTEDKVLTYV